MRKRISRMLLLILIGIGIGYLYRDRIKRFIEDLSITQGSRKVPDEQKLEDIKELFKKIKRISELWRILNKSEIFNMFPSKNNDHYSPRAKNIAKNKIQIYSTSKTEIIENRIPKTEEDIRDIISKNYISNERNQQYTQKWDGSLTLLQNHFESKKEEGIHNSSRLSNSNSEITPVQKILMRKTTSENKDVRNSVIIASQPYDSEQKMYTKELFANKQSKKNLNSLKFRSLNEDDFWYPTYTDNSFFDDYSEYEGGEIFVFTEEVPNLEYHDEEVNGNSNKDDNHNAVVEADISGNKINNLKVHIQNSTHYSLIPTDMFHQSYEKSKNINERISDPGNITFEMSVDQVHEKDKSSSPTYETYFFDCSDIVRFTAQTSDTTREESKMLPTSKDSTNITYLSLNYENIKKGAEATNKYQNILFSVKSEMNGDDDPENYKSSSLMNETYFFGCSDNVSSTAQNSEISRKDLFAINESIINYEIYSEGSIENVTKRYYKISDSSNHKSEALDDQDLKIDKSSSPTYETYFFDCADLVNPTAQTPEATIKDVINLLETSLENRMNNDVNKEKGIRSDHMVSGFSNTTSETEDDKNNNHKSLTINLEENVIHKGSSASNDITPKFENIRENHTKINDASNKYEVTTETNEEKDVETTLRHQSKSISSLSKEMPSRNPEKDKYSSPTYETYFFDCSEIVEFTAQPSLLTKEDVIIENNSPLSYQRTVEETIDKNISNDSKISDFSNVTYEFTDKKNNESSNTEFNAYSESIYLTSDHDNCAAQTNIDVKIISGRSETENKDLNIEKSENGTNCDLNTFYSSDVGQEIRYNENYKATNSAVHLYSQSNFDNDAIKTLKPDLEDILFTDYNLDNRIISSVNIDNIDDSINRSSEISFTEMSIKDNYKPTSTLSMTYTSFNREDIDNQTTQISKANQAIIFTDIILNNGIINLETIENPITINDTMTDSFDVIQEISEKENYKLSSTVFKTYTSYKKEEIENEIKQTLEDYSGDINFTNFNTSNGIVNSEIIKDFITTHDTIKYSSHVIQEISVKENLRPSGKAFETFTSSMDSHFHTENDTTQASEDNLKDINFTNLENAHRNNTEITNSLNNYETYLFDCSDKVGLSTQSLLPIREEVNIETDSSSKYQRSNEENIDKKIANDYEISNSSEISRINSKFIENPITIDQTIKYSYGVSREKSDKENYKPTRPAYKTYSLEEADIKNHDKTETTKANKEHIVTFTKNYTDGEIVKTEIIEDSVHFEDFTDHMITNYSDVSQETSFRGIYKPTSSASKSYSQYKETDIDNDTTESSIRNLRHTIIFTNTNLNNEIVNSEIIEDSITNDRTITNSSDVSVEMLGKENYKAISTPSRSYSQYKEAAIDDYTTQTLQADPENIIIFTDTNFKYEILNSKIIEDSITADRNMADSSDVSEEMSGKENYKAISTPSKTYAQYKEADIDDYTTQTLQANPENIIIFTDTNFNNETVNSEIIEDSITTDHMIKDCSKVSQKMSGTENYKAISTPSMTYSQQKDNDNDAAETSKANLENIIIFTDTNLNNDIVNSEIIEDSITTDHTITNTSQTLEANLENIIIFTDNNLNNEIVNSEIIDYSITADRNMADSSDVSEEMSGKENYKAISTPSKTYAQYKEADIDDYTTQTLEVNPKNIIIFTDNNFNNETVNSEIIEDSITADRNMADSSDVSEEMSGKENYKAISTPSKTYAPYKDIDNDAAETSTANLENIIIFSDTNLINETVNSEIIEDSITTDHTITNTSQTLEATLENIIIFTDNNLNIEIVNSEIIEDSITTDRNMADSSDVSEEMSGKKNYKPVSTPSKTYAQYKEANIDDNTSQTLEANPENIIIFTDTNLNIEIVNSEIIEDSIATDHMIKDSSKVSQKMSGTENYKAISTPSKTYSQQKDIDNDAAETSKANLENIIIFTDTNLNNEIVNSEIIEDSITADRNMADSSDVSEKMSGKENYKAISTPFKTYAQYKEADIDDYTTQTLQANPENIIIFTDTNFNNDIVNSEIIEDSIATDYMIKDSSDVSQKMSGTEIYKAIKTPSETFSQYKDIDNDAVETSKANLDNIIIFTDSNLNNEIVNSKIIEDSIVTDHMIKDSSDVSQKMSGTENYKVISTPFKTYAQYKEANIDDNTSQTLEANPENIIIFTDTNLNIEIVNSEIIEDSIATDHMIKDSSKVSQKMSGTENYKAISTPSKTYSQQKDIDNDAAETSKANLENIIIFTDTNLNNEIVNSEIIEDSITTDHTITNTSQTLEANLENIIIFTDNNLNIEIVNSEIIEDSIATDHMIKDSSDVSQKMSGTENYKVISTPSKTYAQYKEANIDDNTSQTLEANPENIIIFTDTNLNIEIVNSEIIEDSVTTDRNMADSSDVSENMSGKENYKAISTPFKTYAQYKEADIDDYTTQTLQANPENIIIFTDTNFNNDIVNSEIIEDPIAIDYMIKDSSDVSQKMSGTEIYKAIKTPSKTLSQYKDIDNDAVETSKANLDNINIFTDTNLNNEIVNSEIIEDSVTTDRNMADSSDVSEKMSGKENYKAISTPSKTYAQYKEADIDDYTTQTLQANPENIIIFTDTNFNNDIVNSEIIEDPIAIDYIIKDSSDVSQKMSGTEIYKAIKTPSKTFSQYKDIDNDAVETSKANLDNIIIFTDTNLNNEIVNSKIIEDSVTADRNMADSSDVSEKMSGKENYKAISTPFKTYAQYKEADIDDYTTQTLQANPGNIIIFTHTNFNNEIVNSEIIEDSIATDHMIKDSSDVSLKMSGTEIYKAIKTLSNTYSQYEDIDNDAAETSTANLENIIIFSYTNLNNETVNSEIIEDSITTDHMIKDSSKVSQKISGTENYKAISTPSKTYSQQKDIDNDAAETSKANLENIIIFTDTNLNNEIVNSEIIEDSITADRNMADSSDVSEEMSGKKNYKPVSTPSKTYAPYKNIDNDKAETSKANLERVIIFTDTNFNNEIVNSEIIENSTATDHTITDPSDVSREMSVRGIYKPISSPAKTLSSYKESYTDSDTKQTSEATWEDIDVNNFYLDNRTLKSEISDVIATDHNKAYITDVSRLNYSNENYKLTNNLFRTKSQSKESDFDPKTTEEMLENLEYFTELIFLNGSSSSEKRGGSIASNQNISSSHDNILTTSDYKNINSNSELKKHSINYGSNVLNDMMKTFENTRENDIEITNTFNNYETCFFGCLYIDGLLAQSSLPIRKEVTFATESSLGYLRTNEENINTRTANDYKISDPSEISPEISDNVIYKPSNIDFTVYSVYTRSDFDNVVLNISKANVDDIILNNGSLNSSEREDSDAVENATSDSSGASEGMTHNESYAPSRTTFRTFTQSKELDINNEAIKNSETNLGHILFTDHYMGNGIINSEIIENSTTINHPITNVSYVSQKISNKENYIPGITVFTTYHPFEISGIDDKTILTTKANQNNILVFTDVNFDHGNLNLKKIEDSHTIDYTTLVHSNVSQEMSDKKNYRPSSTFFKTLSPFQVSDIDDEAIHTLEADQEDILVFTDFILDHGGLENKTLDDSIIIDNALSNSSKVNQEIHSKKNYKTSRTTFKTFTSSKDLYVYSGKKTSEANLQNIINVSKLTLDNGRLDSEKSGDTRARPYRTSYPTGAQQEISENNRTSYTNFKMYSAPRSSNLINNKIIQSQSNKKNISITTESRLHDVHTEMKENKKVPATDHKLSDPVSVSYKNITRDVITHSSYNIPGFHKNSIKQSSSQTKNESITNSLTGQSSKTLNTSGEITIISSKKDSDSEMHTASRNLQTAKTNSSTNQDIETANTWDEITLMSSTKESDYDMRTATRNVQTIMTNSLTDEGSKTANNIDTITAMTSAKNGDSGMQDTKRNTQKITIPLIEKGNKTVNTSNKMLSMKDWDSKMYITNRLQSAKTFSIINDLIKSANTGNNVTLMTSTNGSDSGMHTTSVSVQTIKINSLTFQDNKTANTSDKVTIILSKKISDSGIKTTTNNVQTIKHNSLTGQDSITANAINAVTLMPSAKNNDSGMLTTTRNSQPILTNLLTDQSSETSTSDKITLISSNKSWDSEMQTTSMNVQTIITNSLTDQSSITANTSNKKTLMSPSKYSDSGIQTTNRNSHATITTPNIKTAYSRSEMTLMPSTKGSDFGMQITSRNMLTIITSSLIYQDNKTANTSDKITLMTSENDSDSGMHTKTRNVPITTTNSINYQHNKTLKSSDEIAIISSVNERDSGMLTTIRNMQTETPNSLTFLDNKATNPSDKITIMSSAKYSDSGMFTTIRNMQTETPNLSTFQDNKAANTSDKVTIMSSAKYSDSGMFTTIRNMQTETPNSLTFQDNKAANTSDKVTLILSANDSDSVIHTTNRNVQTATISLTYQHNKTADASNKRTSMSSANDSDSGVQTAKIYSLTYQDNNTINTNDKIAFILSSKSNDAERRTTSRNMQTTNSLTDHGSKMANTSKEITLITSKKNSDYGIQKTTSHPPESIFSGVTIISNKTGTGKDIDISSYDLLISYNTSHLWGEAALTFNVPCPLDEIILDFEGVSVSFSSLKETQASSEEKQILVGLKRLDYKKQMGRIMIQLIRKIKPKYDYVLSLKFISEVGPFERGATLTTFLTRSVGDQTKQRTWIIGTFLSPNFGKLVFPCRETPERRSVFHLRLYRNTGDEAVSNTMKEKTEMISKKDSMDDFYTTPAIPISSFMFYILPKYDSFIVERTPSLAFWFPPYLKYSVEQIVNISSKILDFFIEYFQYNLPIKQISIVVIEDLYSDPPASFATISISSKYLFEKYEKNYEYKESIYHFLAKQFCDLWIGNIVSFNSWNDIWIKEGFSMYMAHLATMNIYEDYDFSSFIMRIQQDAYRYHRFPFFDENKLDKHELYTNSKVANGTPFKGAFLLHMVYNILKPQPFQEAIRIFFKAWAKQSVSPDVFWSTFNIIQENLDIKEFINSWAFNHYPTLNVDLVDHTVIVKQVPYLGSNYDYSSWWIPLNYLTGKDIHFDYTVTHWMKKQSIQIKFHFNDTWIIFNPHYSAFARFNYSRHLWKMIISGLRKGTAQLPSSVKAQLLDDAFTLASESFLDYSVPMTMALYLKNEEKYSPWFVALKHFSYLAEVLINYPEWQIFQQYMAGIMSDVSLKLQIKTNTAVEKEIQGQLRKILMTWSCLNDLSNGCDKWTLQKFLKWKDDPSYLSKNMILTELKSLIFCMGAKFYDDETSKYLYSFSKTQMITSGEALRLLRGVTCTNKFRTFMEILNDMFDTNNPAFSYLRLKEFVLFLKQSHLNSLLSFRYLKYNWKTIYERFHESNGILNAIIEGATYFLRTKEHYNEVLTLKKTVPESDISTLASLDQAIDQIVYNINWDTRNLNKLRKWLKFYNKTLV